MSIEVIEDAICELVGRDPTILDSLQDYLNILKEMLA